jgi:hypothetical protein
MLCLKRNLAGASNADLGGRSAGSGPFLLNGLHHVHALQHLAEDGVLAVQPRGHHCGDEKLRALGVGSSIGHTQISRSGVLNLEVLICAKKEKVWMDRDNLLTYAR